MVGEAVVGVAVATVGSGEGLEVGEVVGLDDGPAVIGGVVGTGGEVGFGVGYGIGRDKKQCECIEAFAYK